MRLIVRIIIIKTQIIEKRNDWSIMIKYPRTMRTKIQLVMTLIIILKYRFLLNITLVF